MFLPQVHTKTKAKMDAKEFYEAGQGRCGTNEQKMLDIICLSPSQHLQEVNNLYVERHGFTLWKALELEVKTGVRSAAVFNVSMRLRPHITIAILINEACKGIGTDILLVTACIIRYQNILPRIMEAYIGWFGETIQDLMKRELKGPFKKNYLQLILNLLDREKINVEVPVSKPPSKWCCSSHE